MMNEEDDDYEENSSVPTAKKTEVSGFVDKFFIYFDTITLLNNVYVNN